MRYFHQRIIIALVTFFLLFPVFSAITSAEQQTLHFSIVVSQEPECSVINSITDIGDIYETLIDGTDYKKTRINFDLTCKQVLINSFKMTLFWPSSAIMDGKSVVLTSIPNLGLAIYNENKPLNNNAAINFIYGNQPPVLFAVPIKPSGVSLQRNGTFNGTVVMSIDYQ